MGLTEICLSPDCSVISISDSLLGFELVLDWREKMVGFGLGMRIGRSREFPHWIEAMLKGKYFEQCPNHDEELRRKEINVFCIECRACICLHCFGTPLHSGHKLLQIRRYVYQDVVRIHDLQKFMDCSGIMPYTLNGAKVILLNPRASSKASTKYGGSSVPCKMCDRMLTVPNSRYCCIACKVAYEADNVGDSSEFSNISEKDSNSSSDSGNYSWLISNVLKPLKPKTLRTHRRKGIPHRAPIC